MKATLFFVLLIAFITIYTQIVNANPVKGNKQEICKLPEETGPCLGFFINWRFDIEKNKCVQFLYGGCGGNANNFNSKDACSAACKVPGVYLLNYIVKLNPTKMES